jgi:hypothetical protein
MTVGRHIGFLFPRNMKIYHTSQNLAELICIHRRADLTRNPVEILRYIFILTLAVKSGTLSSIPVRSNPFTCEPWVLYGPWALAQVCSLWRVISLSFPGLWIRMCTGRGSGGGYGGTGLRGTGTVRVLTDPQYTVDPSRGYRGVRRVCENDLGRLVFAQNLSGR